MMTFLSWYISHLQTMLQQFTKSMQLKQTVTSVHRLALFFFGQQVVISNLPKVSGWIYLMMCILRHASFSSFIYYCVHCRGIILLRNTTNLAALFLSSSSSSPSSSSSSFFLVRMFIFLLLPQLVVFDFEILHFFMSYIFYYLVYAAWMLWSGMKVMLRFICRQQKVQNFKIFQIQTINRLLIMKN